MIIKNSIQATLSRLQIIPVITIDNPQHAAPLAETLLNAGLHCAEITFRTEAAVETLRTFASFGQFTLGAGTVIDKEQLKAAIEAGADFIVSPGFDPALVAECLENIKGYAQRQNNSFQRKTIHPHAVQQFSNDVGTEVGIFEIAEGEQVAKHAKCQPTESDILSAFIKLRPYD